MPVPSLGGGRVRRCLILDTASHPVPVRRPRRRCPAKSSCVVSIAIDVRVQKTEHQVQGNLVRLPVVNLDKAGSYCCYIDYSQFNVVYPARTLDKDLSLRRKRGPCGSVVRRLGLALACNSDGALRSG